MPRVDPRTIATAESRSKGGKARAEKLRAERDHAKAEADARLAGITDLALDRLEQLLRRDEPDQWARAVREVLDRVMGRPSQRLEVQGRVTSGLDMGSLSKAEKKQLLVLLRKVDDGAD